MNCCNNFSNSCGGFGGGFGGGSGSCNWISLLLLWSFFCQPTQQTVQIPCNDRDRSECGCGCGCDCCCNCCQPNTYTTQNNCGSSLGGLGGGSCSWIWILLLFFGGGGCGLGGSQQTNCGSYNNCNRSCCNPCC